MTYFAPFGASTAISVTQSSQAVALPTMPSSGTQAIALVTRQADIGALYIKLGTGAVSVTISDGMRVFPGTPELPTIIGVSSSETHLAILCEGAAGTVFLTSGTLLSGDTTTVISDDAVTNAKLANMAQSTIKGRAAGAGTGDPTDLSESQVKTILGLQTSTTDNAAVRYDGTTGNQQGSSFIIDDSGHVSSFGGNIKFPATAVASADANTLDDYEEGTWTPAVSFATPGDLSVTYANQLGHYTKIGRQVFVNFLIVTSAFTHTTASGDVQITGLPFASTAGYRGGILWQGITKANYTDAVSLTSSSLMNVQMSGSGQTRDTAKAADMPSGGTVFFGGTVGYA